MVGCSMGLIEHYWYCWLDRLCVGRTMIIVLKKVVIDQLVCAPGIGLWYFIGEESGYGPQETLSETHWLYLLQAWLSRKDAAWRTGVWSLKRNLWSTPRQVPPPERSRGRSGPATVLPTPSGILAVCLLGVCLLHSRHPSSANSLFDDCKLSCYSNSVFIHRWTCVCGLWRRQSTSTTFPPNSASCTSTWSAWGGTPTCPTSNTE